MRGLAFNNDGTKMFTVGQQYDKVYEYDLTSPFDITTLSYSENSLVLNSQENSPTDIRFNHDGTKMYISGSTGQDINEYTLSSAFDISDSNTITFEGSFSVSSSDVAVQGFSFNNDGTKIFTTGTSYNRVNEVALTSPFSLVNISGENSGDVIDTSSASNSDSDADVGDTLTVTNISHSNLNEDTVESGSTYSQSGGEPGSIEGTYGTITIGADGSYQYVADLDATDALDAGDVVTDVFTYTVSDGNGGTDTATITITIVGINDAPTAVDDTDTITASGTVDDEDGAGTLISDDSDPDASASLYITKITPSGGDATSVTYNSTKSSNAATITGSKGTLTFGSDGSYSYTADLNVTTGPDEFTYTLTDGTSTTTATLTIDVVVEHFGYIQEGKTLTVANTAGRENGTSTGSHTGDIIYNDTLDTLYRNTDPIW